LDWRPWARLRQEMNRILGRHGIAGRVYGDASTFHVYFGDCPVRDADDQPMWTYDPSVLKASPPGQVDAVHMALQVRGVDLMSRMSGVTSAAHTEGDVQDTPADFEDAIDELVGSGAIRRRR
jgi:glutamate-1-semialdehyde aminotransferase